MCTLHEWHIHQIPMLRNVITLSKFSCLFHTERLTWFLNFFYFYFSSDQTCKIRDHFLRRSCSKTIEGWTLCEDYRCGKCCLPSLGARVPSSWSHWISWKCGERQQTTQHYTSSHYAGSSSRSGIESTHGACDVFSRWCYSVHPQCSIAETNDKESRRLQVKHKTKCTMNET